MSTKLNTPTHEFTTIELVDIILDVEKRRDELTKLLSATFPNLPSPFVREMWEAELSERNIILKKLEKMSGIIL